MKTLEIKQTAVTDEILEDQELSRMSPDSYSKRLIQLTLETLDVSYL